jgi:hypothetical protein
MPLLFERLLEKIYNIMIIKEKLVPGRDSKRASKFHGNHSVILVGLFELPATLPSNCVHWCDIRWHRVLVVDTNFRQRPSGSRKMGRRGLMLT